MLGFKNRQFEVAYGKMEAIFKESKEVASGDIELNIIKLSTRSDDEDEEMIKQINSLIDGLRDGERPVAGCKLRFFPAKGEIVLESSESNIIQLNITENLHYRLGLTDNIIYPNVRYKVKQSAYMKAPEYYLMAEGAPDIRQHMTL